MKRILRNQPATTNKPSKAEKDAAKQAEKEQKAAEKAEKAEKKDRRPTASDRVTMSGSKPSTPPIQAAPAQQQGNPQNRYLTQPGISNAPAASSSQAAISSSANIPSSYLTTNPKSMGSGYTNSSGSLNGGKTPPLQPPHMDMGGGAPKTVISEYTLPANVFSQPVQSAPMVVSEYTIPSCIPEQTPVEKRWEADWHMLGPHPELGCVRHEQLLQFFGPVPDSFKGIMFELTGDWVSKDRFFELLSGFGPFPELVNNISTIFSQRWFFNFMKADEANRWLQSEPPGSFLVRFADPASISTFMVCYVMATPTGQMTVVQERILSRFPEAGYIYEGPSGPMHCQSLFQVLDTIHDHTPLALFQNPLADEVWFHGSLSADEATEMLRTRPAGTFLVRFSTQQFSYTISQIVEDQQFISVTHTRLMQTPDGWFRDPTTGKQWPTLENFLTLANLVIPLVNRIPMIRKLGAQLAMISSESTTALSAAAPASGPVFIE